MEGMVKQLISYNNHNLNLTFPAIIVNTANLRDGMVDVKPIVNYMNPLTWDTFENSVIRDVRLIYPSTSNSTISFPVSQGDTVGVVIQTSDISKFKLGNKDVHDPEYLSYGNCSNAVAYVGFETVQDSCLNPNNYHNGFDAESLNIVHNKGTPSESNITIKKSGEIFISTQSSKSNVNINGIVITSDGDILVKGMSLFSHMRNHTHIGNQGAPTSPPQM